MKKLHYNMVMKIAFALAFFLMVNVHAQYPVFNGNQITVDGSVTYTAPINFVTTFFEMDD